MECHPCCRCTADNQQYNEANTIEFPPKKLISYLGLKSKLEIRLLERDLGVLLFC